jgi:hypothetical protein
LKMLLVNKAIDPLTQLVDFIAWYIIIGSLFLLAIFWLLTKFFSRMPKFVQYFINERKYYSKTVKVAGKWSDFKQKESRSFHILGTEPSLLRAVVIIFWFTIIVNLFYFFPHRFYIFITMFIVEVIFILFFIYILSFRNFGRAQRYEIFFLLVYLMPITYNGISFDFENYSFIEYSKSLWNNWIGISCCVTIVLFCRFLLYRFILHENIKNVNYDKIRILYRIVIIHPIIVLFLGITLNYLGSTLLISYFTLRFYLKNHIEKNKIIFFRSFNHNKTPIIFSNVIYPACRSYGHIIGLSGINQTTVELNKKQPIFDVNVFDTVGDDAWQSWVDDALRETWVAIFDITDRTANLDWEIDLACKILGEENLIFLSMSSKPANDNEVLKKKSDLLPKSIINSTLLSITYNGKNLKKAKTALKNALKLIWETHEKKYHPA